MPPSHAESGPRPDPANLFLVLSHRQRRLVLGRQVDAGVHVRVDLLDANLHHGHQLHPGKLPQQQSSSLA